MEQINILVFPCGSEIGLELYRALKDIRFVTLYGASSVSDHGERLYRNYIPDIPYVTSEGFIEKLNECIVENKIDYVFPAMDSVILELSEYRKELKAKLLTSSEDAVRVCRSKRLTYDRLSSFDFIPSTYTSPDDVTSYPVLVKPSVGQGSQGVAKINSREELVHLLAVRDSEQVICEYLPGEEYTVDCFTDRHRKLRYVSPRIRRRVKNGISVNSETICLDEEISSVAEKINSVLEFQGAWFFQVKRAANGKLKLLECATRVAGTMCVERARGINLPLLTVMDVMGLDVEIIPQIENAVVDRALYNVFSIDFDFDELYIDFDDTIIVHGRVNTEVMALLYQCVEKGIPITLLSRHLTDIYKDLKAARICPELFSRIIVIGKDDIKADFISPSPKALFIDDSFAERRQMIDHYGIVCLGVECVEALIDYKK